MEPKFAKVLDSGRRIVINLKRQSGTRFEAYLSGASGTVIPRLSTLKSPSDKLGKRKKPHVCETNCRGCKPASCRSLLRYYTNFMNSGLPKRLMFYQNGEWVDHVPEVVDVVRKDFEHKRAAVEVNFNDFHLMFDFVHMAQFNFGTSVEQPLAWIDEGGCCFFPEVSADADEQHDPLEPQEIKLLIDIEVNGLGDSKSVENCGEPSPPVKRIKVDQMADTGDSHDVGDNQHLEKKKYADAAKAALMALDSEFVKEMFRKGMNLASDVKVAGIFSLSGTMWRGRSELFVKQVQITRKFRGDPNVRYAWLPSSRAALSGIKTYGLGHFGLTQIKSTYGIGLHLAAGNRADTSANYCDVDENGLRYMVLCRVIMGNMEVVPHGSKQFHPSTQNFDSGVDDLQNPQHYVVWSMNINTHIYPQYVVSFKTTAKGIVLKNDCKLATLGFKTGPQRPVKLSNAGSAIRIGSDRQSNLKNNGGVEGKSVLNPTTRRVPQSPWLPFPLLVEAISNQVHPDVMKSVNANYEQFKIGNFSREEFVGELRIIVGDALLRSIIASISFQPPSKDDEVKQNKK